MKINRLKMLFKLLTEFRDDSVDHEEYDRRNDLLRDVIFQIEADSERYRQGDRLNENPDGTTFYWQGR